MCADIIGSGPDPNIEDNSGYTARSKDKQYGYITIMQLIDNYKCINIKDIRRKIFI